MEYYLDAGPMIRALSGSPCEFEMDRYGIRHRPSRHWLRFDVNGNAELLARCNCVELPISERQSEELRAAVAVWQDTYWRPLMAREAAERRVAEINQAFAEHFRPRSKLRRAVDALLAFVGISRRPSLDRIDPSLPEAAELQPRPVPATPKQEHETLLSV
jgi:hypothetical protein